MTATTETPTDEIKLDIGRGETLVLPARKTPDLTGMKIEHVFSRPDLHPYDAHDWEKRDVVIWDFKKKRPSFQRTGVEVPKKWTENAVKITAAKYLFGGDDRNAPEFEDSMRHPLDRIANTYTVWGWANGYFATLQDAKAFNWELKAMLVNQMWAPNSPVWFNLGHWEQWRWGRPDLRPIYNGRGNKSFKAFRKEDGSLGLEELNNNMQRPQSSACFLTEVEDSMESILSHQITEGRIFASGSGVGINLSTMRSSFEPISGRGRSSGPISFNKGWDRMAGAIKSGGRSRRAARMVLMDSSHPNVREFLNLKNDQEHIAKVILREHAALIMLKQLVADRKPQNKTEAMVIDMIKQMPTSNEKLYDGSMDGEIYGETISDQNANHSVSLLGDFWAAYWANEDYCTRWVTKPDQVQDTFPARELLLDMAKAVYENAEPGCHNNDWINIWSPVKSKARINTSNPCSEYLHLNNTSCNLSSFNVYRFLGEDGQIRVDLLRQGARLAMIAADLNIEECGFPVAEIAVGTYSYRTTGIGFGNIGGLMMSIGIPYDSDEGRYIAGLLTSHLTAYCWETSAEMGEKLGSYHEFPATKDDLAGVIRLHKACHETLRELPNKDKEAAETAAIRIAATSEDLPVWDDLNGERVVKALVESFKCDGWDGDRLKFTKSLEAVNPWANVNDKAPFRNSFVSLYAPMGTISAPLGIYDEGTTSGEPDYSLVKYKSLSGGGTITMFNSLALKGLQSMGYDEWHVREAALEVAGINGLVVACGGSAVEAANHLSTMMKKTEGPVRAKLNLTPLDETVLEFIEKVMAGTKPDIDMMLVNGVGNVENIRWLPDHHKEVFDCAATLGGGTRAIHHSGHIRMLGALMPFVSGAVSKTVNLPHYATVPDIVESFEMSHKMGVKCIALYRDGSKGVSVFAGDDPETKRWKAEHIFNEMCRAVANEVLNLEKEASKPRRKKLPGQRDASVVKFDVGGQQDGFLVVGIYPDGTCGEVFGRLGQGGSFSHGMFESFCKAFSVMLQWGVPLPKAISSFKNTAFDPSGFSRVANGEADIRSCKSVVDLMMRILEWLFPEENGYRLRNRTGELFKDIEGTAELTAPASYFDEDEGEAKKRKLSAAEECPECKSLSLIQDGKCKRCSNCGYSGGGCGG